MDRRKYGPLLLCLPPEPLAVITLHVVLSALLAGARGSPAAGVVEFDLGREAGSTKVMPLVLQIGRVRPRPGRLASQQLDVARQKTRWCCVHAAKRQCCS